LLKHVQSFRASFEIARSKKGQAPCGRHATRALGGALPKTGTAPWLGMARLMLMLLYGLSCFVIWLWVNTYENTIFRGMNIHKSQLF
jgi:hypothetical protein